MEFCSTPVGSANRWCSNETPLSFPAHRRFDAGATAAKYSRGSDEGGTSCFAFRGESANLPRIVDGDIFTSTWSVELSAPRFPFAVGQRLSPVLTGSATFPYSAVYPLVAPFYNQFPNGEVKYEPPVRSRSAAAVHLDLTTVQPVAPPDPQMIFLDGSVAPVASLRST